MRGPDVRCPPPGRHRRQAIIATLLCLLVALPTAIFAEMSPRLVRVGAYQNSPKITINPDSTVSGFWPDLIAAIALEEDWRIEYVPGTWQDGMDRLAAGEIDIMPDVAYTADRAARFDFSAVTVMMSWTRLYVAEDNQDFASIHDLNGRTVAALAGSVNLDGPAGLRDLVRSFNLDVNFLELADYDAVFQAIESGRAYAGISNRNFGNKNAWRYKVKKTPLMFQPVNLKFAFTRGAAGTPALKKSIDARLDAYKQQDDSVYYQLLAHYFEAEVAEKRVAVWPSWLAHLLQAAGLILIVGAAVLIGSRREVARKTRELRQRNEQLASGERRYREIFDAPTDAIVIHDMESGKIMDVNRAMLEMYEMTYEEALQAGMSQLSAEDGTYDGEYALTMLRETADNGPQVFEWHARSKSGRTFWVEVALRRTNITGKERIIAVVRDIEERKRAASELAAERERLLVTLRSIGDAVITTDIDGHVDLMNKVAEGLTGWTAAEATGRPLGRVLTLVDGITGEPRPDPVPAVLTSSQVMVLTGNTALISRDGRRRLIADSIAPIRDASSRTIGAVLVFRDVTDQIRLEKEILKVKKLESVGVLAGGIAHDFNNILATILGDLELAAQRITGDRETLSLLEGAEAAVTRASDLTKQLLTFSRGGEPVKEAASLTQIIRDSAEFVLHGSSVAMRYHCADGLWLIDSDPGQISQVVQNLVINARHAMPEGGVVDIACENCPADEIDPMFDLAPGDYVSLTVTDGGVGIPAGLLDRIFDPFFTTKQRGSGLGLAVTHSIIVKHGGHIAVESQPGRGTRFTIHLPAAARDAEAAEAPVPVRDISRSGRILVMDDEKSVRDIEGRMLQHLGFTVELVAGGHEAFTRFAAAAAAGQPFDLVIMDLTVPGGMGGEEAARRILAEWPDARLMVASGYSNDRVLANFRQYGFRGALVKPTTLANLARAVDAALA